MFPPRVILAAIDFSEPARVALRYAARLATQCDAELHVLHAEDPFLAGAARAAEVDLARETREELTQFVQSAAPAGNRAPRYHVVGGSSVEVICDIAERERADLIVAGMHGMSGVERLMFGSTTEGVLRKAGTSVLVVPHTWAPPRADRTDLTGTGPVVVGIEPTIPALSAARAACTLAAVLDTSVEAVHIVPDLPVPARWMAHAEAAVAERVRAARTELASALDCIGAGEVPVTLHVESGHIAERLADIVRRSPGSHPLLVLGRRATGALRYPPGRAAYRVLTLVDVPVLMYLEDA